MNTEQDEIDAMLFRLTLECARPSWRFRAMFSERERKMIQFSINTMMGTRQHNKIMSELERRYGPNMAGETCEQSPQCGIPDS